MIEHPNLNNSHPHDFRPAFTPDELAPFVPASKEVSTFRKDSINYDLGLGRAPEEAVTPSYAQTGDRIAGEITENLTQAGEPRLLESHQRDLTDAWTEVLRDPVYSSYDSRVAELLAGPTAMRRNMHRQGGRSHVADTTSARLEGDWGLLEHEAAAFAERWGSPGHGQDEALVRVAKLLTKSDDNGVLGFPGTRAEVVELLAKANQAYGASLTECAQNSELARLWLSGEVTQVAVAGQLNSAQALDNRAYSLGETGA